jgi:hypothetical protein
MTTPEQKRTLAYAMVGMQEILSQFGSNELARAAHAYEMPSDLNGRPLKSSDVKRLQVLARTIADNYGK